MTIAHSVFKQTVLNVSAHKSQQHTIEISCKMIQLPYQQEAFEKCLAHSPLRAAARRIAIQQVSLLSHAACASMSTTTTTRQQQRQRQRVREGTTMSPWNGPNELMKKIFCVVDKMVFYLSITLASFGM